MSFTVFVDRDGVINRDSDEYIKSCEEFEFIPGSIEAIRLLSERGFDIIIITNQSVIGRKMISRDMLDSIFKKMTDGLNNGGGKIMDVFFCPHAPDDGCDCRKPLPGMILAASEKYDIDLDKSCMIGDSAKDIECGKNAGCKQTVLVRTGNGLKAAKELKDKNKEPDYIGNDLLDAVKWIIQKRVIT